MTRIEIARRDRNEKNTAERQKTLNFLHREFIISHVPVDTNMSRRTVMLIKDCMNKLDSADLSKLINSQGNRRGKCPVLSQEENKMIKEVMLEASNRGFSATVNQLTQTIASVASDRRTGFKSVMPSDDFVRSWRADYRDLSLSKVEKLIEDVLEMNHTITS